MCVSVYVRASRRFFHSAEGWSPSPSLPHIFSGSLFLERVQTRKKVNGWNNVFSTPFCNAYKNSTRIIPWYYLYHIGLILAYFFLHWQDGISWYLTVVSYYIYIYIWWWDGRKNYISKLFAFSHKCTVPLLWENYLFLAKVEHCPEKCCAH